MRAEITRHAARNKIRPIPPSGIQLKPLQEIHAEQVNSVWPFRDYKTDIFVTLMIRLNLSVGAFDDNGNLLAWCLRLPLGSLGLLQVEEAHKRKGLGSLVVRQLSKWIAASGEEVNAPVVCTNVASRSMFEKLGFEIVDSAYWANMPAKTLDNQ